jgi:hypothetical protein
MLRPMKSLNYSMRALFALFVLLCLAEIAIRYDGHRRNHRKDGESLRSKLLAASCHTHHRMKPFLRLSLSHPDSGKPSVFSTNSLGLRGDEPAIPKPPGLFRVVCLGGNQLLGFGLDESQTFCSRLEEYLGKATRADVEVVNAGVPDFSPILAYLQVRHELAALQPDLLVFNFDMRDVANDYRYRRHTVVGGDGEPLACPGGAELTNSNNPEMFLNQFCLSQWCWDRLKCSIENETATGNTPSIASSQNQYAWISNDPPNWSVYIQQTLSVLGRLDGLARGIGARMILAVHPSPWQVSALETASDMARNRVGVPKGVVYTSEQPFDILSDFACEFGIPLCNTAAAFRDASHNGNLYQKNAPQFTEAGHELYAIQLSKHIVDTLIAMQHESRPATGRHSLLDPRASSLAIAPTTNTRN